MTPPALDLDWQLRRAADSLRRTTASVPVGTPPPPRRRLGRIVAGAVAIVAVVAGAALIWKGYQHREPKVTTGPPGTDVSPLILDPPPAGMATSSAQDLPATAEGALSLTLYQGQLAFDGNAAVDLAVAVTTDGETLSTTGAAATTVRGHRGEVTDSGPFGGPGVTWEEAPDLEITLASHTLDTSLLLEIAEGLRVDDTAVELGGLPEAIAGLAPVANVVDAHFSPLAGVSQSHSAHVVEYRGDGNTITLAATTGDARTVDALAWATNANRVHEGGSRTIYTALRPDDTVTAVWQEDDGTVAQLVATNSTPGDVVLMITESVREPTDAEWEALIEERDP